MNKNTKILLGVFVVLLGIYLLFFRSSDTIQSDKLDAKLFKADSTKIEKIELFRAGDSVTFEKVNNQWMITKPVNYPADTGAVYQMLSNLKNFQIEGVASDKQEKFSTFLDSVNHTVVTVFQEGKELGSFELGKMAVSQENSYIKKPGDNKVLLASNLVASNFTKPLTQYRYKYITGVTTAGIKSVQFKSTDSNKVDFELKQDSLAHWSIGADSVQHAYVDAFVNMLGNMNAEDFKDTTMTTFPPPIYTITVNGTQPLTINFYKEAVSPTHYIMQVSGIKQLFRCSDATIPQWCKKKSDFIPPPPPPPKKEDTKKDTKKK